MNDFILIFEGTHRDRVQGLDAAVSTIIRQNLHGGSLGHVRRVEATQPETYTTVWTKDGGWVNVRDCDVEFGVDHEHDEARCSQINPAPYYESEIWGDLR